MPTTSSTSTPSADAAMPETLERCMAEQHLAPLWQLYTSLVRREPQASEPSVAWRWSALQPALERAAREVGGDLADHRALILRNPHLGGRVATTTNLLGAVQCVLDGERTLEHRHTAAACRVVLQAEGAWTYVDGKRCLMEPNDFIVTPGWAWHSHANTSGARAIWLDLLDVPLMAALDTTYGSGGPAAELPTTLPDEAFAAGGLVPEAETPAYTPRLRWAWRDVSAALDAAPTGRDGSRELRFTDPMRGGAVTHTLDARVLDLPAGRRTTARRCSANAIAVVLQGEGRSNIGEVTHHWSPRDVFTVPHWQWVTHEANSSPARLLFVSDHEALRRLGLARDEVAE